MHKYKGIAILCAVVSSLAVGHEPSCRSGYDYEFKVLEKLADIEKKLAELTTCDKLGSAKQADSQQYSAFNAHLKTTTTDLAKGTTVVFDECHLNIGSNYDPQHGVFTATIRGLYVFTLTTASTTFTQAWIMKNGKAYEYTFTIGGKWQTGSASVILQLEPQDRVWVAGRGVIQSYGAVVDLISYHSSFTGHLIKAL